jgi:hypothetical protein
MKDLFLCFFICLLWLAVGIKTALLAIAALAVAGEPLPLLLPLALLFVALAIVPPLFCIGRLLQTR